MTRTKPGSEKKYRDECPQCGLKYTSYTKQIHCSRECYLKAYWKGRRRPHS